VGGLIKILIIAGEIAVLPFARLSFTRAVLSKLFIFETQEDNW
jgi:hypothetical protein